MKRLVLRFIVFFLPVLVLLSFLEVLSRKIPNDFKFKRDYLDSHSNEIEILILGNSHSYRGLNPEFFSCNVFNAAYSSQILYYDLEILKKYKNNFDSLKWVVIPIVPALMYSEAIEEVNYRAFGKYHVYYGFSSLSSRKTNSIVLNNVFYLRSELKKTISYYVGLTKMRSRASSDKGWFNDTLKPKTLSMEEGRKSVKRHYSFLGERFYSKSGLEYNLEILEAITDLCNELNVKLLLFTPPVSKYYRAFYPDSIANMSFKCLNSFGQDKVNCYYLNYYRDTLFQSTDYYDPDHLSHIGAEKLTKLIKHEISRLSISAIP